MSDSQHRSATPDSSARAPFAEEWVIWNGTYGIAAMVTIGRIEVGEGGRKAWLEKPFEMAGPFDLDELIARGRIAFAACVVMSRERWRALQEERREAQETRREREERRWRSGRAHGRAGRSRHAGDEREHRQALDLPIEGKLESGQIKAAYRRLARKAHPDAGGSHEHFLRITEARNALLEGHA
jgi:hypothetical protein